MANQIFYTLFLFLLSTTMLTASSATTVAAGTSNSSVNFIQASCNATTYPTECVNSLISYADTIQTSPQRLAETALNITATEAQSTKVFVWQVGSLNALKKREIQAIKDCIVSIHDAVDDLTKSINEVKLCASAKGRDQFFSHMSNAQTWTSAALTNANTCSDGFAGQFMDGEIKNSVQTRIVNLGRITCNALALVNAFAKTY
ncbi:hypothetical protein CARUB_v10018045mg [Capsella rubella]|uniref:Pectinesterase inhibitor domain-containing protein n=1 Tax=Capsella rubella TaxID=81985 RepID=R0FRD3_9BRAS|nr:pectinesterase inhibitor 11 [Capsella rubella]EOA24766.1 hypothetical protein CARUB_v10018045mg [Capsella rubella]